VAASQRFEALSDLAWDEAAGCWRDLLIVGDLVPGDGPGLVSDQSLAPAARSDAGAGHLQGSAEREQVGATTRGGATTAEGLTTGGSTEDRGGRGLGACSSPLEPRVTLVAQSPAVVASNWVPLWAGGGAAWAPGRAAAAAAGLLRSGLIQPSGLRAWACVRDERNGCLRAPTVLRSA
jgi:hypothetical protein